MAIALSAAPAPFWPCGCTLDAIRAICAVRSVKQEGEGANECRAQLKRGQKSRLHLGRLLGPKSAQVETHPGCTARRCSTELGAQHCTLALLAGAALAPHSARCTPQALLRPHQPSAATSDAKAPPGPSHPLRVGPVGESANKRSGGAASPPPACRKRLSPACRSSRCWSRVEGLQGRPALIITSRRDAWERRLVRSFHGRTQVAALCPAGAQSSSWAPLPLLNPPALLEPQGEPSLPAATLLHIFWG